MATRGSNAVPVSVSISVAAPQPALGVKCRAQMPLPAALPNCRHTAMELPLASMAIWGSNALPVPVSTSVAVPQPVLGVKRLTQMSWLVPSI